MAGHTAIRLTLYCPELKLYLISLRSKTVNMLGELVGDRRPICHLFQFPNLPICSLISDLQ